MTSVMARKFRVNFKYEDFSVNLLPLAREILHETSYGGLLFQGNWNTPITQEVYKKHVNTCPRFPQSRCIVKNRDQICSQLLLKSTD